MKLCELQWRERVGVQSTPLVKRVDDAWGARSWTARSIAQLDCSSG